MEATTAAVSGSRRTAITESVGRVAPAVVTVQTEVVERVPADVFEQFFGGRSGTRQAAGLGSGFIIRPDGAIVTNCGIDRSRARGASRWGTHTRLHVSAGLGTSPYAPARFFCPPEASLLTLVPRASGSNGAVPVPAEAVADVG